jgi:hypothetical protein
MIWRPHRLHRPWWESKLCSTYGAAGLATRLWAQHLAPVPHMPAENDRDHLRW